jgi:hypothetical protein
MLRFIPQTTLLVLAALAVAAALALTLPATRAYACTPVPGYDAVASSSVIVEGRVVAWRDLGGTEIEYDLAVERVFKGTGVSSGSTIQVRDFGSYQDGMWISSGGLCGTFAGDPAGTWLVAGLTSADSGWRTSLPDRFYNAAEPEGEQYDDVVDRVRERAAPGPPATGQGNGAADGTAVGLVAIAVVVGLGMAAAVASRAARRERR